MLLNPDSSGYYGDYGGKFIPEILTTTFDELIESFQKAKQDPDFWKEYVKVMQTYSCRPTPVTKLDNFSEMLGAVFRYIANVKTSITQVLTRPTMSWDRDCSSKGWAKVGSSLKQVQDSTVWQQQLWLQDLGWIVWFTWGPLMSKDNVRMCFGWNS